MSMTAAMLAAIGRAINEPGLFIEIGLTPVVRLSSYGT